VCHGTNFQDLRYSILLLDQKKRIFFYFAIKNANPGRR
jgi:hypothetical protein